MYEGANQKATNVRLLQTPYLKRAFILLLFKIIGRNGFAVDIYSCIPKTGTEFQLAVSAKGL